LCSAGSRSSTGRYAKTFPSKYCFGYPCHCCLGKWRPERAGPGAAPRASPWRELHRCICRGNRAKTASSEWRGRSRGCVGYSVVLAVEGQAPPRDWPWMVRHLCIGHEDRVETISPSNATPTRKSYGNCLRTQSQIQHVPHKRHRGPIIKQG
jgi:hypothetical protein